MIGNSFFTFVSGDFGSSFVCFGSSLGDTGTGLEVLGSVLGDFGSDLKGLKSNRDFGIKEEEEAGVEFKTLILSVFLTALDVVCLTIVLTGDGLLLGRNLGSAGLTFF